MKVVTFNIRCDYRQDGNNNFCFRQPLILEKLRREKPDVVCFQEVLPHVAAWLKDALPDYLVMGCGRSEDLRDEQLTVACRKDRMNLIRMETFWLSETHGVPGSRYPRQSICPRTGTEVLLEDMEATSSPMAGSGGWPSCCAGHGSIRSSRSPPRLSWGT